MGKHTKTLRLIEVTSDILVAHHPMTVRQVYYQLVSRQVIENSRGQYQAVSNALVDARKDGTIPWKWIGDRLRRPRHVSMWRDLAGFGETVKRAYRRDVWADQPGYFEIWLEKDALSGIFEDVLKPYGVTLNVGRGYDGWSSIHAAANRFGDGSDATILYFGDFDPSGEDMVRSLEERLNYFDCHPEITKCAVTPADVTRYDLPPDFTKRTDTRSAAFVAQYGDVAVELDALPLDVLRARIREEVRAHMDMSALEKTWKTEEGEREQLLRLLSGTVGGG
ncbi:MAG: hypothetical protein E3J25_11750 [Anaerolineales bacterium]|nr:MAG: hypothetical protein E3J25_11750 [Anaerolineales bacterium]